MIIKLIDDTVVLGARQSKACEILGLVPTTVQRWKKGREEDQRHGPKTSPPNTKSAPACYSCRWW